MRQPKSVSRVQRAQGALEGGAPEQAPSRVLKRAVSYLERVKRTFAERPEVYRAFLAVMHAFKEQRVEITGLVTQVYQLFEGHPNLLIGFNTFLPIGHSGSVAKPPSSQQQQQQDAGANRETAAAAAADIDGEAEPVQLPAVAVSTGR